MYLQSILSRGLGLVGLANKSRVTEASPYLKIYEWIKNVQNFKGKESSAKCKTQLLLICKWLDLLEGENTQEINRLNKIIEAKFGEAFCVDTRGSDYLEKIEPLSFIVRLNLTLDEKENVFGQLCDLIKKQEVSEKDIENVLNPKRFTSLSGSDDALDLETGVSPCFFSKTKVESEEDSRLQSEVVVSQPVIFKDREVHQDNGVPYWQYSLFCFTTDRSLYPFSCGHLHYLMKNKEVSKLRSLFGLSNPRDNGPQVGHLRFCCCPIGFQCKNLKSSDGVSQHRGLLAKALGLPDPHAVHLFNNGPLKFRKIPFNRLKEINPTSNPDEKVFGDSEEVYERVLNALDYVPFLQELNGLVDKGGLNKEIITMMYVFRVLSLWADSKGQQNQSWERLFVLLDKNTEKKEVADVIMSAVSTELGVDNVISLDAKFRELTERGIKPKKWFVDNMFKVYNTLIEHVKFSKKMQDYFAASLLGELQPLFLHTVIENLRSNQPLMMLWEEAAGDPKLQKEVIKQIAREKDFLPIELRGDGDCLKFLNSLIVSLWNGTESSPCWGELILNGSEEPWGSHSRTKCPAEINISRYTDWGLKFYQGLEEGGIDTSDQRLLKLQQLLRNT